MKISALLFAALSVAAVTNMGASAAQTADNSAPARPQPLPVWSGSYLGLQFGGHFTYTHVATLLNGVAPGAPSANVDLSRDGLFGAIQFGDGRQVRGLYVGGEADSAFGRFVSGHILAARDGGLTSTYEAHRRFVGTVRGKVGRPFGRLLVYGTGGLAIAGLAQGVNFNGPAPTNSLQRKAGSEGVELGYAIGGGVEYRASRRFSYAAESLYYGLQNERLKVAVVPGPASGDAGYQATLQNSGSLLRVSANYHF